MGKNMPWQREFDVLKQTKPTMRKTPDEDLTAWQEKARKKLVKLTGLENYENCEHNFILEYKKSFDDFDEYRFIFQSEPNYTVPCHLCVPHIENPPLMICLQGHSTGMHVSLGRLKDGDDAEDIEGERDFMPHSVKRGYAALVLEQRCFGERGGTPRPNCHQASMVALITGRTTIAARVWDIMTAIDVIAEQFSDIVDTDKIYCMGNSGGGTATIYATEIDTRIKGAIPSCAFCSFVDSIGDKSHCECNYIPNIARYFDMADICGLIAPRPLVIVNGKDDGIFPLIPAQNEFNILKEIYYNSSENCRHVVGNEGHRFYAEPSFTEFKEITG